MSAIIARKRGGERVEYSPRIGGWVPGLAVHGLFVLVVIALCTALFSYGLWIAIVGILTAIAVVWPRLLAPWALILLFGASVLWRTPSAGDWHFFVLLAGLHLLHVLGSQMLTVPWRSRLQVRSLGGVLFRFLAIQAPCQLVSWGTLLLFAPHGLAPAAPLWARIGAGVLAALALLALVIVLTRPMIRRASD